MIVFEDKLSGHAIGVNLKVMFSFFKLKPERFVEVEPPNVPAPSLIVIRHPLERMTSCYWQKCKDRPKHAHPELPVEGCQELYMRALGLSDVKQLMDVSLADFVERVVVPHSDADGHLRKQTARVPKEWFTHADLFAMEQDLPALSDRIECDLSAKENATQHPPWRELLDIESTKKAMDVYADDFDILQEYQRPELE